MFFRCNWKIRAIVDLVRGTFESSRRRRRQAFQLARFQAWAGLQLDLLQTATDAQDPAALAELGSKYREMTLKFNTKSLSIHERLSCLWNELHSDVQALFEAPSDHHEAPLDTAQAVKRIEQAA